MASDEISRGVQGGDIEAVGCKGTRKASYFLVVLYE